MPKMYSIHRQKVEPITKDAANGKHEKTKTSIDLPTKGQTYRQEAQQTETRSYSSTFVKSIKTRSLNKSETPNRTGKIHQKAMDLATETKKIRYLCDVDCD